MLTKLKFPLLYVLEALLWVPLLVGFVSTTAFLFAEPIAVLNAKGASLPATWEAALYNHRKYVEWYLRGTHQFEFGVSVFALITSAGAMLLTHLAQQKQMAAASPERARAHKIARFCLFVYFGAGLLAIGKFVFSCGPSSYFACS
jgi:hypothetical protein